MDIDKQKSLAHKEKATQIAIHMGMALIRREHSVYGLKADGAEVEIATAEDGQDVWELAVAYFENKDSGEQQSLDDVKPNDKKHDKSTTLSTDSLKVYTDGGSRGNPGPSASGYVIMGQDESILEEGGEYLGVTTNNQAEYQAVKLALEQAQKFTTGSLDFYIDSLLVVNQMNGVWKIKNRELWPVHEAIKELVTTFDKVTFTHVRREYNKLADEQVNIVLDSHQES